MNWKYSCFAKVILLSEPWLPITSLEPPNYLSRGLESQCQFMLVYWKLSKMKSILRKLMNGLFYKTWIATCIPFIIVPIIVLDSGF